MQKSYKTGLILAAACSSVASAAVTVQLSLNIDPITQTYQAYANLIDTSNETLGLHGLEFNISSTGGVSVLSSTLQMPAPTETLDGVTSYQKGFTFLRSNGTNGTEIRAFQQNVNQLSTTGSGLNNILEGFGESAFSENNGLNASTSIAKPALIASGSYSGSSGTLSISGSTGLTTLLPASLPAATVGGASFSTFSPTSVTGQTFSIPFTSIWTGAAVDGNNWNNNSNWSGGLPGYTASGDSASFTSAITGPTTIAMNGAKTLGTLVFNNLNSYTISPGTGFATLTMNNGASNSSISDNGGSHSIAVPVAFATNTNITVLNTPTTLTISGNLNGTGSLTKLGSGTLSLTGSPGYSGTTTVSGGRLKTIRGIQNSANLSVTSGTLEILNHGGSTAVTSAALVTTSGTGRIELHNNDLISNYGAGPSNYNSIVSQIMSGLTLLGGSGAGIGSAEVDSQAVPGTMLAVVDNGDPLIAGAITELSGFAIPNPNSSVLVKYTWFGDSNLDGVVDGSDYALLDTGFGSNGMFTGWVFGDYDYSGVVDGSDYALMDTGFLAQTAALPEPGMLGIMGLVAIQLLTRRRTCRSIEKSNQSASDNGRAVWIYF